MGAERCSERWWLQRKQALSSHGMPIAMILSLLAFGFLWSPQLTSARGACQQQRSQQRSAPHGAGARMVCMKVQAMDRSLSACSGQPTEGAAWEVVGNSREVPQTTAGGAAVGPSPGWAGAELPTAANP